MADKKISELTEANLPLDGTEDLPIVQGGSTVRCSTQDIADLAGRSSVITVKVSLSSAEILALNTTPKQLVAAPGSGKILQPLFYLVKLSYATAQYATNTTLQFNYDGLPAVGIVSNSILNRTESFIMRQAAASTTAFAFAISTSDITNKGLFVSVTNGNPTAGDGTLDIYVSYVTINL